MANCSSKCLPRQWSTTTMTLNCINPLSRVLPLSCPVRKGCCFKHQRHLIRQKIVYLAKINEFLDFIFTGGLVMPYLMTGISFHASTHPYAYYISAPKSWDPKAPLRLLTFYARQFDMWMKSWRTFFYLLQTQLNEASYASFSSSLKFKHHGGPLEVRRCSRILSNVGYLGLYVRHLEFKQESTDGRAIASSHLLFKQSGVRLYAEPIVHCLRCLHEFDKSIFGLTLNPRHVEIGAHL